MSESAQRDRRRSEVTRIAAVSPRRRVTVAGIVRSAAEERIGNSPGFRCVIADGSGEISLVFLGHQRVAGLRPGRRCTAEGMTGVYRERLVVWNPRYELEPDPPDEDEATARRAAPGRPGSGQRDLQLDGHRTVLTQRHQTG